MWSQDGIGIEERKLGTDVPSLSLRPPPLDRVQVLKCRLRNGTGTHSPLLTVFLEGDCPFKTGKQFQIFTKQTTSPRNHSHAKDAFLSTWKGTLLLTLLLRKHAGHKQYSQLQQTFEMTLGQAPSGYSETYLAGCSLSVHTPQ